ncbi:MAG: hypothetical protein K2Q14_02010, partial [Gammaproteobacteria bacterium]|nr:hypothetical protein [Gammaproteobacteria bacterium]
MKSFTDAELKDFIYVFKRAIEQKNWPFAKRKLKRLSRKFSGAWPSVYLEQFLEGLKTYINHHLTGDAVKDLAFIKILEARPPDRNGLKAPGLRESLLRSPFKILSLEARCLYVEFFVAYYLEYNDYVEATVLLTACGFTQNNKVDVSELTQKIRLWLQDIESKIVAQIFIERLNAATQHLKDSEKQFAKVQWLITHHRQLNKNFPLNNYLHQFMRQNQPSLYKMLGNSLHQCLSNTAIQLNKEVLTPDEKIASFQTVLEPLTTLATLWEELDNADEAHRYYDKALDYSKIHQLEFLDHFESTQNKLEGEASRLEHKALNKKPSQESIISSHSRWLHYHKKICDWREEIQQYLLFVKNNINQIKTQLKNNQTFLTQWVIDIIQEAEHLAGIPPEGLSYGFVGLGSFALGVVHPYSDLDFLVLMNECKPEYEAYLACVLRWVYWSVFSLGEGFWTHGFHLDSPGVDILACLVNPLRAVKTFDKWQAELEMEYMEYVKPNQNQTPEYASCVDSLQGLWLYGQGNVESLKKTYYDIIQTMLEKPFQQNKVSSLTYREFLSLSLFAQDYRWNRLLLTEPLPEIVKIKTYSNIVLHLFKVLNLLWDLKATSLDTVFDALVQRGLNNQTKIKVEQVFYRLQELRLLAQWQVHEADVGLPVEMVKPWLEPPGQSHLLHVLASFLEQMRSILRPLDWKKAFPLAGRTSFLNEAMQRWDTQLRHLSDENAQGRLELTWVSVDENKQKYTHNIRSLLLDAQLEQYFLTPEKKKWRQQGGYKDANHVVFRLKKGQADVHFKLGANYPGLDLAGYVFKALLTDEVLPVCIGKLRDKTGQLLPEVVTITPTLPYLNVAEAMSKLSWTEKKVDPYYFSLYTILAGLLNPFDAKPDNHIWVPLFNEEGQVRYAMVDVDNEQIFQAAVIRNGNNIKLQSKSIYFCFDLLKEPIHPRVMALFLSVNPYELLKRWLTILEAFDQGLFALFKDDIERFHQRKDEKKTTVPILLEEKTICDLWGKLNRLQEFFSRNQRHHFNVSHLDVLHQLEPAMKGQYQKILNVQIPNPGHRFFDLLKDYKYSNVIEFSVKSAVNQSMMRRSGLQNDIPTLEAVLNRDKYSPKKSLTFLEEQLAEYELAVQPCRKEILEGQFYLWNQYLSPYFREKVVNGFDFKVFSEKPEAIQEAFKNKLRTTSFQVLNLSQWSTLTDNDIGGILKNSFQLTHLIVVACPQLTSNMFFNLLTVKDTLEVLDMSEHPTLDVIESEFLRGELLFPQLRRLILNRCYKLERIDIKMPRLVELS